MRQPIYLSLRVIKSGSSLPSLGISRTKDEDSTLRALHAFAFNSDIDLNVTGENKEERYASQLELYEARLDELLHPVIYALLFRRLHPAQFLTNTVAISLALMLLKKDTTFKRGSICTQNCAAFQYYIRATATNELRLKTDNHGTYVPVSGATATFEDKIKSDNYSELYEYVIPKASLCVADANCMLGFLLL